MSHNILLPSKLKIVKEEGDNGVYEIEGLYPGYGHTLGNSLRRIILSSIPGASITTVRIDGVDHEYSVMDGINEDVLTVILNLRRVRFKLNGEDTQTVRIKLSGQNVVTAGSIEVPGQVEILNKDQFICEMTDKKSSLDIEMTVEPGVGFYAKSNDKKDKREIGVIAVDAFYSPIRKVSYEVENMRVGDRTDHNRLRFAIQTDGTLSAREALEYAIKVMLDQLSAVLDLKHEAENPVAVEEIEAEVLAGQIENESKGTAATEADPEDEYSDTLKTRIDSLEVSTRTQNALSEAGIRTLGVLEKKTDKDLLALDGIGAKGVTEIKEILAAHGLELKK